MFHSRKKNEQAAADYAVSFASFTLFYAKKEKCA